MSILPQQKSLFRHPYHLRTCQPSTITRVYCSTTTTTTTTLRSNPVEPPLITTLKPNPVEPPLIVAISQRPIVDKLNLQSTWSQRAWVASGSTTVLVSLVKSVLFASEGNIFLEPIFAGLLGYILADLGSGFYHWAIDNYGDASTPLFGSQIEAFQGHHKWPWIITRRQLANNLHALARAITFVVVPIDLASNDPVIHAFVGVCSGCIMFSQLFHAWAHGTKSRLPPLVVALQDAGVLVSRAQHAAHHRSPYNNNYCIVSGAWNSVLDEKRVFEALEMVFFFKFGVRPRSWTEPNSDWTEEEHVDPDYVDP